MHALKAALMANRVIDWRQAGQGMSLLIDVYHNTAACTWSLFVVHTANL